MISGLFCHMQHTWNPLKTWKSSCLIVACPLSWVWQKLLTTTLAPFQSHFVGVNNKIVLGQNFNPLVPGTGHFFKFIISDLLSGTYLWEFPVQLPSHEGQRTLVNTQHWFRHWLGAIRKQAFTEPVLIKIYTCHHTVSLGPNKVNGWQRHVILNVK